MTRLEELPSGKRVLYVDIGNLSVEEQNEYITRMSKIIMSKIIRRDDAIHYVIPVKSTESIDKFIDLKKFAFKMLMIILGINFIGLLILIMKGTT